MSDQQKTAAANTAQTTAVRGVAATPHKPKNAQPLKVFYNDQCPICVKEMGFYQRLKPRGVINFIPLSTADAELARSGLTKEEAIARLHVALPDGTLCHSVAAFAALWQRVWLLAPLAWIVRLPGVFWLATKLYHWWLKVAYRPHYTP